MQLSKAWTAIDMLSNIRKSDLCSKIKRKFFQAVVVNSTIWKYHMDPDLASREKAKGNCQRILGAILNGCWKQNLTKEQFYNHLPLIFKVVGRTRFFSLGEATSLGEGKL